MSIHHTYTVRLFRKIEFVFTYQHSIIGFITFRFQFHHILDENFGVPAQ